jgi:hypothetical protein
MQRSPPSRHGSTASSPLASRGITAHRSNLTETDVTVHRGIAVTTVARTLTDLVHSLDEDDFVRAVRQAQFLKLFDAAAVADALERRP